MVNASALYVESSTPAFKARVLHMMGTAMLVFAVQAAVFIMKHIFGKDHLQKDKTFAELKGHDEAIRAKWGKPAGITPRGCHVSAIAQRR